MKINKKNKKAISQRCVRSMKLYLTFYAVVSNTHGFYINHIIRKLLSTYQYVTLPSQRYGLMLWLPHRSDEGLLRKREKQSYRILLKIFDSPLTDMKVSITFVTYMYTNCKKQNTSFKCNSCISRFSYQFFNTCLLNIADGGSEIFLLEHLLILRVINFPQCVKSKR